MIKLEKYVGNKTYMYPSGAIATPERILADYPAILTFTHVVETDEAGQVFMGLNNLAMLRGSYNIAPELTEDEAIKEIESIMNAPVPEPEPSAEERIASALEYQNMASMPDVEVQ